MGVEEFFNAIRERCSSDDEYPREVLKARGFLLEDDGLVLSDNCHKWDEESLREILRGEEIGDVEDGKITLSHAEKIENIFDMKYVGGSESFGDGEGWPKFVRNSYAPKVPIYLLEPFVARYIKAISACGVRTCGSCDGNKPNQKVIRVEIDDLPNVLWHKLFYRRCLSPRFDLDLRHDGQNTEFRFSAKNRWKVYMELNRAAEFLYNNRIILREIRRKSSDGISNSLAKHHPEDAARIFFKRANELLREWQKQIRMNESSSYTRHVLPESKRFFAKRVRRWVLHPDNDPVLTEEIRNGEHPGLEILLEPVGDAE